MLFAASRRVRSSVRTIDQSRCHSGGGVPVTGSIGPRTTANVAPVGAVNQSQPATGPGVPLVVARPIQVTSPAGTPAQPRVVARYEGPLPAPIAKGARLGVAAVTLPDGRTIEYPLEAGADVPRQGVVGRIFTLARHYLFGWLS